MAQRVSQWRGGLLWVLPFLSSVKTLDFQVTTLTGFVLFCFFPFQLVFRVFRWVMFMAVSTFTLMPSDSLRGHAARSLASAAGMGIDWQADLVSHPGQVSSSGLPHRAGLGPACWNLFQISPHLNPEKTANDGWEEKQERGRKENDKTWVRTDCEFKKDRM